jgi:hypothetical protein
VIICHEHKLVYILLPHTAGTAVAAELCDQYSGELVLKKHSAYHEFLESRVLRKSRIAYSQQFAIHSMKRSVSSSNTRPTTISSSRGPKPKEASA